jgi:protein ImuB
VRGDNRVTAVNSIAAAAGVRVGMRRREAESVCPTVVTLAVDPGSDAMRFEPVVLAVEGIVPRVEVVAPGMLMVPVTGAVPYYGGERRLAERVMKEVDAVAGDGFRFGLAAGPFAAGKAAERATPGEPLLIVDDDQGFLSSLSIDAIGAEDLAATFRWLGITTLGELAAIPRAAIVSRFGAAGVAAHRTATGEDRQMSPRAIPDDLAVAERFEPPLVDLERASFAARSLANRLMGSLAPHGIAPYRVRVEAEAADGAVRERVWRSVDPFDDAALADRVRWQLRSWMEGAASGITGGLAVLRIVPDDLAGTGRQLGLEEDAASAAATQRALTEVQAIVGHDGLLGSRPQGGRDPGERVQWHRWDEPPGPPHRRPVAPWPGRIPSPSPALVPPTPQPFTVEWDGGLPVRVRLASRWEPVLSWAGPWRHVGRWWNGEGNADRYQLVTSAGAFLCEVREEATWLLGIYD